MGEALDFGTLKEEHGCFIGSGIELLLYFQIKIA